MSVNLNRISAMGVSRVRVLCLVGLLATCCFTASALRAEPISVHIVGPDPWYSTHDSFLIAQELDNILSAATGYSGSSVSRTELSGRSLIEAYYHPSYRDATRAALTNRFDHLVILPGNEFSQEYPEMVFDGVLQMSRRGLNAGSEPLLLGPIAGNDATTRAAAAVQAYRIANGCGIHTVPGYYAAESAGLSDASIGLDTRRQAYLMAAMLFSKFTGLNAADTGYVSSFSGTPLDVTNLASIAESTLSTHAGTTHYSTSSENEGIVRYRYAPLTGNSVRFGRTGSSTEREIHKVMTPMLQAQGYTVHSHLLSGSQGFSQTIFDEAKSQLSSNPDDFLCIYTRWTSVDVQDIIDHSQANLLAINIDRHYDGQTAWDNLLTYVHTKADFSRSNYSSYGWLATPIHLGAARLHDLNPAIAFSYDGTHMGSALNYMTSAMIASSMLGRDLDPELLPESAIFEDLQGFNVGRQLLKQLAFLAETEAFVPDTDLIITPASALPVHRRTPYDHTFTATGGTGPYTWSEESDAGLPPGLTLSSGGQLSGTTTNEVATWQIVLKVEDSDGAIRKAPIRLSLLEPDLQILGNDFEIAFDDTTPTGSDGTYFGVTEGSVANVFVITNNSSAGSITLTASPRVTVISDSGYFAVSQDAAPGAIAAGGATSFEVTYAPVSGGIHTGTVSVASTYPTAPVYSFSIVGIRPSTPAVITQGSTPQEYTSSDVTGVLSDGGSATAWICWGAADAGTDSTSDWENVVSLGSVTEQISFSTVITGLATNVSYWYRCYVTNAAGAAWSDSAETFSGDPLGLGWKVGSANAGLWYGAVLGDPEDHINTPNPKSMVLTNVAAYTEGKGAPNTTEIYTGYIYDDDGQLSFTECISGHTRIWVDGSLVVTSDSWSDRVSTTNLDLTPGWHAIDIRISGDGANQAPGVGYDPAGGSAWQTLTDPGDGSFLGITNKPVSTFANLAPTAVTDSGATLEAMLNAEGTNYDVYVHWGQINAGSNAGDWISSAYVGSLADASSNMSHTVSTLASGQTYYYAFRAHSAGSNIWASPSWQFTTTGEWQPTSPIISSSGGAQAVSGTNALLIGSLVSTGGAATTVTCCWNAGSDPGMTSAGWGNSRSYGVAAGPQGYTNNTAEIGPLMQGTTYYYRYRAVNSFGTNWSQAASFTTLAPPLIDNAAGASSLSETSATLRGELTSGTSAGGWICWGDHDAGNDSTSGWDNVISVGEVTEGVAFSVTALGLSTNATYWYRCYASNSEGSDWSDAAGAFSGTPAGWVGNTPGLWYGETQGEIDETTPNPESELVIDVSSKTEDSIAGNTTEILTGYIFDGDGQISFTENIDDKARIWIDGALVISNDAWSARTDTGNLNLEPGWHAIEIRIWNGSGGSGPASGIGIGYDPEGGTAWQTLTDPGDGSFLSVEPGAAIANRPPTGILGTQATLNAELAAGGTNYSVYAYWGTSDGGTNAGSWAASAYIGSWTNVSTNVSYGVTSLLADTGYFYTFRASNSSQVVWASPGWQFRTLGAYGAPPVTANHSVPHSWLAGCNSGWTNDYESAAMTDHDADGFTTWQEYWCGTDPQDSNSVFRIDAVRQVGGNVEIEWRHAAIGGGIPPLVIESTTNLLTGPWVTAASKSVVNGLNSWSESATQKAYYRLAVTNMP